MLGDQEAIVTEDHDVAGLRAFFEGCNNLKGITLDLGLLQIAYRNNTQTPFHKSSMSLSGDIDWRCGGVRQTYALVEAARRAGRTFESLTLGSISHHFPVCGPNCYVPSHKKLKRLIAPLRRLRFARAASSSDEDPDYEVEITVEAMDTFADGAYFHNLLACATELRVLKKSFYCIVRDYGSKT